VLNWAEDITRLLPFESLCYTPARRNGRVEADQVMAARGRFLRDRPVDSRTRDSAGLRRPASCHTPGTAHSSGSNDAAAQWTRAMSHPRGRAAGGAHPAESRSRNDFRAQARPQRLLGPLRRSREDQPCRLSRRPGIREAQAVGHVAHSGTGRFLHLRSSETFATSPSMENGF
jgi:hypothetical protein